MQGMQSIRSLQVVRQECGVSQAALPMTVYAKAVIELGGRIWWELERLAQLYDFAVNPAGSQLLLTAATLRLELLVLMDSCESASWATMLPADERRSLHSMLSDVLEAIAVSSDELQRGHIECAQNRVFDEVLAQFRGLGHSPTAAERYFGIGTANN